jgi:cholesterol oxidase
VSQGIAIGSGVYIDEHTHIEAVRYPNGVSDNDSDRWPTWPATHSTVAQEHPFLYAPSPFKTLRVLQPLGWAREFVILLCMQALDGIRTHMLAELAAGGG